MVNFKKTFIGLFIFILILGSLAGCSSSDVHTTNDNSTNDNTQQKEIKNDETKEETNVRIVSHEMGETEIIGIPKRIVALEFSFVDTLAALDVKPVGIADDNDPTNIIEPIRSRIGDYTSVGSRYEVNLEIISSLKPDLIIGDIKRNKEIYELLQEIAPTILLDSFSAGYEESKDTLPIIAEAIGQSDRVDDILTAHDDIVENFKALIPSDEKRTVLPAVANATGFFGHSAVSFTGSLLEAVGLKNGIESDEAYNKMTLEQLLEFNPDILFIMTTGEATIIDEWKESPLWQELEAVKQDKIFFVARNKWSLSRGLIAAEEILKEATDYIYNQ